VRILFFFLFSCSRVPKTPKNRRRRRRSDLGSNISKLKSPATYHSLKKKKEMIYDVNSPYFRSFLKNSGGAKNQFAKGPTDKGPRASENKPVMND
jgi:hypothetical protein